MKYIILLVTCFLLFNQQQFAQANRATLIKGDWETENAKTPFDENKKGYISFEDTVCSTNIPWGFNLKYSFNGDSLYIESLPNEKWHQKYHYKITQLTADSMVLFKPASDKDTAHTLTFKKIHIKNNITPSKIYFSSSMCFGTCPDINFEIDASGNMRFFGGMHAKKTGGQKGKISSDEYAGILTRIRNLPVDSLKPYYEAPWTDDQTCGILIETTGKQIKSTAYGNYEEPVELTILLNKLLYLYEHIDLHPDKTVTSEYFSSVKRKIMR